RVSEPSVAGIIHVMRLPFVFPAGLAAQVVECSAAPTDPRSTSIHPLYCSNKPHKRLQSVDKTDRR
ncbi:MAG TPA: hypothetical protein VKB63_05235, partial [Gemmatimonadales bacterium]|nr:hypothetical protein [Gemmatimonadales bacterium]